MVGEVNVLLVSSGNLPEALVAELRRLGVTVNECSFGEAEELLETTQQDLVALIGARGAIELANMIDDHESAPKMVIVAERRELAKLRGLNRDVVVSLFAMETTEKVVGQRIESLARRAHRRIEQRDAPPEPQVQKTSLGLPSAAAAVGKVNLKKPPGAKRPPITESVPPSSGSHPGAEPKTPAPPEADKPTAPLRAEVPPNPPQVEVPEVVDDDDLLESIRPAAPLPSPAEAGPGLVTENLPMMSLGPDDEPSSPANPPTLPPAAKSQAPNPDEFAGLKKKTDLSLKIDPGDLDLSSAESALENLDSVKMDLTEDIIQHAKEGLAPSDTKADIEERTGKSKAEQELDLEDLESIRPDAPEESTDALGSAKIGGIDHATPLGSTELPADLARTLEDDEPQGAEPEESRSQDDESSREDSSPDEGTPAEEPVASASPNREPPAIQPVIATEAPDGLPTERKKGGGKGIALVAALLLASGAAGAAYKAGVFGGQPDVAATTVDDAARKASASSKGEPESEAPADKRPIDDGVVAVHADEKKQDGIAEDAAAEPGQTAAPDTDQDTDVPPSDEPAAQAVGSGTHLDNPFKMVDSNKPSCEALLSGAAPEPGRDPVSEASKIWADARKAIVSGKKEQANRLMCSAVRLYDESAAVEGLAHHYLAVGSFAEALKWVKKADQIRPGQLEMGNLRGDIYGMMGQVQKAREVWLETLHIRPEEAARIGAVSKDYSVEAGRHLRRGDFVRAELFFRRSVILDPKNLNGIIGLAKTYQRLEMLDYTQAFCEMSLQVSDVIPEVHVLLGDLAQARGNKEEAKTRYERALRVRPDFYPAKRGLNEVK